MLPEKVNICGIPHKVVLCSDAFDSDEIHYGQIDYMRALITINEDASEELQMQTLFHEVIHGMLVMIGRSEESRNEEFVQALANALYQTFRLKEQ